MRLQRVSLLSIQLPCLSTNLPRTGTLAVPPHIRSMMLSIPPETANPPVLYANISIFTHVTPNETLTLGG